MIKHRPPRLVGPYNDSPFIIYALCEPGTLEVRYIGLSRVGLRRPLAHSENKNKSRGNRHKHNWVRALHRRGRNFAIRILEEMASDAGLGDAERRHIATFKAAGARLINITDGGERGWKIDPLSWGRFQKLLARALDPARKIKREIAKADTVFRRNERLRDAELRFVSGDATQYKRLAAWRPE